MLCGTAAASVSGGDYVLESSVVDSGGGEYVSGGEYSSRGSVGQIAMPKNEGLLGGGEYASRAGFYNPPHMTYQRGLAAVINLPSGEMRLTLPSGSVDKDRFEIYLNRDPITEPTAADPGKIDEANSKMVHNDGEWSRLFPNHLTEMSIFDEQSLFQEPLAEAGVLTFRYRDDNDDGNLDGSDPPVRVDTLNTWMLDETRNMWVRMHGAGVDPETKSVSVYFGKPGVFALLGAMDDSVSDLYAFPVPFRPNGPQAGSGIGQTGTESGGISFTNVPQAGKIEIFALDGRRVRKIDIPAGLATPVLTWDVRNASGEKVASGVYIWRATSGSNSKTGKLMIIW